MIPKKRYDTNAETSKFYAYRQAWDLLMFGYGYNMFNPAGLTKNEKKEVWLQAVRDYR